MKRWHKKRKFSVRMRSKIKKEYAGRLPSNPVLDPFLMKFVRYNRNGRPLVLESTGWKELKEVK